MRIIDVEHHFLTQDIFDVWDRNEGTGQIPYHNPQTRVSTFVDSDEGVMAIAQPDDRLLDIEHDRFAAMEESGYNMAVLSTAPGVSQLRIPEAVDLCRRTNDYLYGITQKYPDRFLGAATLPVYYPDEAIRELDRCVNELGFVSWQTHSNYGARALDDPEFEPIIAKAAELGVYTFLHPTVATSRRMLKYGYVFDSAGLGFTIDTMTTCMALIVNGTFDKHPGFKVCLGHFGEALPFLMERMNWNFGMPLGHVGTFHERDIIDYFKNCIWVDSSGNTSIEAFKLVREVLGIERIVYGSDYPFPPAWYVHDYNEKLRGAMDDREWELYCHGNFEKMAGVTLPDD